MAQYTKDSLQAKLELEAPKIRKYLDSKGLLVNESCITDYYRKQGQKVSKNAIKKMIQFLSKN